MSFEIKEKLTLDEFKYEAFEKVMAEYFELLSSRKLHSALSIVASPCDVEQWFPEIPEHFDKDQRQEIEWFKECFGVLTFENAVAWANEEYTKVDMETEAYRYKLFELQCDYEQGGDE